MATMLLQKPFKRQVLGLDFLLQENVECSPNPVTFILILEANSS